MSSRKKQLMDLNGGSTYLQMRELFFAEMRNVTITVEAKEKQVEVETEPIEKKKKIHFSMNTNLLADLVVVPNIGIEIPFSESRWTLDASWLYTWIINEDHTFYWRIYGGDLGLRKYFGSRSREYLYEGHHLGLYGQWVTYDIALNDNKGYQSLSSYGGGLVYGFSHSISKNKKHKLDYSIGAGYLGGDYEQYFPLKGKAWWTEHHTLNHIGITKLEISLKWTIGRVNREK